MRVELRGYSDSWQDIKNATMTTVNKDEGVYPSSEWKRKLLLSEHSPIRKLRIGVKIYEIPYWVSVHLTRHKIGIEHFVRTQRSDRTGEDRNQIPQGALVEHELDLNAQSAITISRKRLCKCASKETVDAWTIVLDEIKTVEPELYDVCVPDCVYRGKCHEFKSCGYDKTAEFRERVKNR